MTLEELYTKTGSDYQEVKGRFGSDALIQRFAMKFANDTSYQNLMNALEANNLEEAFRAAHTMKGVAANLGFTALFQAAGELTESLRDQKEPVDMTLVDAVQEQYKVVIEALAEFKKQNS